MSAPAVEQRTSRRHGTGSLTGSGDRLPAPVKERRPALAALAVILIVGGALASGMLVMSSGDRDDYLVVRATIHPGQKIVDTDLSVAQIAGTGANAVAAAKRSEIVGTYATTRIFPGTLITYEMVTEDDTVPVGWAVVGTVLSANQRPAAPLHPGDLVRVLEVPHADGTGDGQATVLLDSATVKAVEKAPTNGAVAVSLLVPLDRVGPVTAEASQGSVALALLPGLASAGRDAAPPAANQPPQSQQQPPQLPQQPPAQQPPVAERPTSPAPTTSTTDIPTDTPQDLTPGLAPGPGLTPGTRTSTPTVSATPTPGTA